MRQRLQHAFNANGTALEWPVCICHQDRGVQSWEKMRGKGGEGSKRESGVEIHEKEHPNVSTDRKNNRSQSDKLRKVMLGHLIQISLPLPHVLPLHSLVFLLATSSSTEAAVCQYDPSSILR